MKNQTMNFAALATLMLAFAAPALAQFEVAPDHFASPSQSASAKWQDQFFEQQAILKSYQALIAAKAKEVEQAGEFLNTAGAMDDYGYAQLAAYNQECELAALRDSLAEPMRMAQATLNSLTDELAMASSEQPAPVLSASAHKAHSKTSSGPSLYARR